MTPFIFWGKSYTFSFYYYIYITHVNYLPLTDKSILIGPHSKQESKTIYCMLDIYYVLQFKVYKYLFLYMFHN